MEQGGTGFLVVHRSRAVYLVMAKRAALECFIALYFFVVRFPCL